MPSSPSIQKFPPDQDVMRSRKPVSPIRFMRPSSNSDASGKERKRFTNNFEPGAYTLAGISFGWREIQVLVVLTVLSTFVRLYHLSEPTSTVFDEVHFGGFASKYIKTKYFMDVHPPLAKLLITFAAWISGYKGNFSFKDIGQDYLADNVPYVQMRLLPAILGIAVVPLAFLTLRLLQCRTTTATLGALLVTFENALITQSRLILLDSPLVFFTATTAALWCGFSNINKKTSNHFQREWWVWLILTGLSLGAVVSCKWVGLFTIATVGLATIGQLWSLLGDLRITPRLYVRHVAARVVCLIVLPALFYMATFEVHFMILNTSGDGDAFMSSEFQHTLAGHGMPDTFADVSLGSTVEIRHWNTQGGYLHSHLHAYPTGSKQQQITLYPHVDDNNKWLIINGTSDVPSEQDYDYKIQPIVHIEDGATIRLEHIATEKRLHSHDHRAPISEADFQNEVSAYGFPGFGGDANDNFRVEIEFADSGDKQSSKRVKALRTKFRLKHLLRGCYLFSHKVKLPPWGFEQQEVTCNNNPSRDNSIWYIETNTHPTLPKTAEKVNYRKPGFLSKFIELQGVMWKTNIGLTDRHAYDSRPYSWPILRRGINFWVKDHKQIYLLGNPVIWWLSSACVIIYIGLRGLIILRAQRGINDFNNTTVSFYEGICTFLFSGWFFHYFPFFLMRRQLFLHHYLPALYFSILLLCVFFDACTTSFKPVIRVQSGLILFLAALWAFYHFSSLTYATPWTRSACKSSKLLRTWDFDCSVPLETYDGYSITAQSSAGTDGAEDDEVIIGGHQRIIGEDNANTTTAILEAVEPAQNPFQIQDEDAVITVSSEIPAGPEKPLTTKAGEGEVKNENFEADLQLEMKADLDNAKEAKIREEALGTGAAEGNAREHVDKSSSSTSTTSEAAAVTEREKSKIADKNELD